MAKPAPATADPANGFWASLGRELAYAVEDIRHKVVEEGWFGRQVTPSTFPRDEPPMAPYTLYGPGGPGVHGPDASVDGVVARRGLEGEILGPEGSPPRDPLPAPSGPPLIEVEPAAWQDREAMRQEFIEACRALSQPQLGHDRGPDQGHDLGPAR